MTLQQQQQQEEEEEEEEEEGVETENHPLFLLDTLYCEEEGIEADEDEDLQEQMSSSSSSNNGGNPFFPSLPLSDQDLFWDEEELLSMFSKETRIDPVDVKSIDVYFPRTTRHEAVQWMLKVNGFYGFTALTAVLAVNYLDRFLTSFRSQRDDDDNNKPWLIHLVAIACLSLAAKVEEVHVPLLLDLQVGGTKYVFEAKTIQRMELLILSTLKWNMHPITPLSFLNHIIRMLGLKTLLHWEFLYRCEQLLLCVISDSRSIYYLPSMLATTTMMHVIDQIEPLNPIDYQDQLLSVLGMKKETLNECYKLVVEVSNRH